MMNKDLQKHRREFARSIRNHQYEVSDQGIVFPKAKALVQGAFIHDVNGLDEQVTPNLVVTQGLTYLLEVGLNNGSKLAAWYLSLYTANYTPLAALTQASYPATASESTSNTEGYSNTTRRAWSLAAPASGSATNNASKAAFTIATATSVVVYGAGLHSDSTKGGTTGTLYSAAKFAAARTLYDTDVFNLGYTTTLTGT